MWHELPIQFIVIGTPVSSQSTTSRSRDEWKAKVAAAANTILDGSGWAFDETRLSVTLFYFPNAEMPGDVDNIVKLTLDALMPRVYLDDELIDRVLVQRFSPDDSVTFASPSETLVSAMALREPALYIKITGVQVEDVIS